VLAHFELTGFGLYRLSVRRHHRFIHLTLQIVVISGWDQVFHSQLVLILLSVKIFEKLVLLTL
jgi:hypothetical protein